ncbi:TIGR03757 family integrating conjugative element protein [Pseudomonas aeruginosa]
MPALPHCPASLRRYSLAAGLCAALLHSLALADTEVLVVTDSHHPIQAPVGIRIIELDLPARINAELAAGLPNDAQRSAALVQQRLRDGGIELQQRIGSAYQDVVDAWNLGITKIPAVVLDNHVVYGEPDVAAAVALIATHRRAQP